MSRGYKIIRRDGKKVRYHRLVAMTVLGITLADGMDVHHIDGNKMNNDPSNLMVMSHADHARLHYANMVRGERGRFKGRRNADAEEAKASSVS